MKLIKPDLVPKQEDRNPIFTGGKVTRQTLVDSETSQLLNLAVINFNKGARNKFHTHTSDQVLIVTAGKGIVATVEEEKTVHAGDIIFIPAGEKHWHGATRNSDFSHIYIYSANTKTKVEE